LPITRYTLAEHLAVDQYQLVNLVWKAFRVGQSDGARVGVAEDADLGKSEMYAKRFQIIRHVDTSHF
jgi:hypothetical protein